MSDARPRLLVFIVAYFYAESTLTSVLERIPAQVRDDYDCEILVVDDASEDHTYLGREYQRAHPEIRMTVLRGELNQGYGGNQKLGYAYAIGAVRLRGPGARRRPVRARGAPAAARPAARRRGRRGVRQPDADAGGALKGGMPLYKFVGNKILTTVQNRLLGSRSREFHSGYRAYAWPR